MLDIHTYQHTYTPTHRPAKVEIVQAEEAVAWAWNEIYHHLDTRNGEHYETEWWERHAQLQAAANEAEERLTALRLEALNECTCDPDPRRESTLCPVCRAANTEREMPY